MTLETRVAELAVGKDWSTARWHGGAVAQVSRTFRYSVSITIDGQAIVSTAGVTLEDAEQKALALLEEWRRIGEVRSRMRLVTP